MKFLISMHINPAVLDALTEEEMAGIGEGHGRFMQALKDSGEFIMTQALVDPSQAAVVRVRNGQPVVTDGPFLEAKEYLGGFYLVDVQNKERAIELAAQIPDAAIEGLGRGGAPGHVLRWTIGGMTAPAIEDLLRELTPQVLGALVRRYGRFEGCEDAVQEAVLAASVQWPAEGVPENPRGWLTTVASRRLIDQVRSDSARREREEQVWASDVVPDEVPDTDDTLVLLFLCCHPTLTAASQTALTLRAVGGLTTAEIARAFLVPEATLAARISRAKQRIKTAGSSFELPAGPEREERLQVVLHVLYLIFNEGYTASSGTELDRVDLATEAIRLTRMVARAAARRRRGRRAAGADAAHALPA